MIQMTDLLVFGFGLAVTIVLGSALASMIVVKNRVIYGEDAGDAVPVEERASNRAD